MGFSKSITLLSLAFLALTISGCSTVNEIKKSDIVQKVESFRLSKVEPDSYWYDGKSYEYNSYAITITSTPSKAHILWNDKFIGDTPLLYRYSGAIDKGDHIRVRVVPVDERYVPQEAKLKVVDELPREMKFNLDENQAAADTIK